MGAEARWRGRRRGGRGRARRQISADLDGVAATRRSAAKASRQGRCRARRRGRRIRKSASGLELGGFRWMTARSARLRTGPCAGADDDGRPIALARDHEARGMTSAAKERTGPEEVAPSPRAPLASFHPPASGRSPGYPGGGAISPPRPQETSVRTQGLARWGGAISVMRGDHRCRSDRRPAAPHPRRPGRSLFRMAARPKPWRATRSRHARGPRCRPSPTSPTRPQTAGPAGVTAYRSLPAGALRAAAARRDLDRRVGRETTKANRPR